ncbi:MAG: YopX family protein [Lentilactobacillus sunkii]|uniref:YopX family protein n=1 Tax=Lentilactobacillus sunkii TaxID=481719 RepID=UPI002F357CAB
MNRQIKFRIWDKKEHVMDVPIAIGFDDSGKIDSVSTYKYLWGDKFLLEQFTGLKDSNGDDIYENDLVLLDPDDPPYQVIFDKGKFELSNDYLGLVYDLSEEHMDCEIIGNIHENPELLKG